jgi:hypothetical protein
VNSSGFRLREIGGFPGILVAEFEPGQYPMMRSG